MRRDHHGRPRKLHKYPNPAQKHLDDIKDAFIGHGLDIMDEVVDRLLNQFFAPQQRPPNAVHGEQVRTKPATKSKPSPSQAPPQTLYDVLQVSPTSTTEVIDAAWKALCKRHHPDHGGDSDLIKCINAAHDILSNPSHREKYDRLIGLRK